MTKSRWFRLVALLATFVLIGAACGGDDDDGDGAFQAGPLGAVDIAPGEPLQIATLQATSGDVASLGDDQVRALEIAVADVGGEFRGHPIELQVEDEECAAEGGQAAAQRVVSDPQVVGIIGTSCSGAGVPASEIMSDAGLVMISGSNTSPFLTSLAGEEGTDHHEGYFRTAHNDEIQGTAAATWAFEEFGVQSAATIHDGDPYTQGLAQSFGSAFEELGGEVPLATAISKGDTDMRPVLTEVAASGAELLFFPIFQPEGDFIAKQAKEVSGMENVTLMGADGLLSDTFVEIPATEGMYFSGPAAPTGGTYQDLVQKYEDEYGEKPIQAFHAHAYDAFNMLLAAIDEVLVEDDDGTLHIDRQELRDAVAATEGFEGITGTLTCDEFGDCADPAIDVLQNTQELAAIDEIRATPIYTYTPEE